MAFIPIPNGVKVAFEFTIGGHPVVMTVGISRADAVTPANLDSVSNILNNWWEAHIRPLQGTDVTLQGVRLTDQTNQFATEVFKPKLTNNTGTSTVVSAPANVSVAVQRKTNLRGRAHRGTSYTVGIPYTQVNTAQTVNPAYMVALLNAWGQFEPSLAVEGWNEAVLSRTLNKAPRAVGVATDVVQHTADAFIDDMGRRLR